MRKILVIARREYKVAVRSKALIITLVLMPVLMGASGLVQYVFKKMDDTREKTYALIDRTPGQKLTPGLLAAAELRNKYEIHDSKTGEQNAPRYKLEVITPSEPNDDAMNQQRYELSQRVENGQLEGILEIGPDVMTPRDPTIPLEKVDKTAGVRFQSKTAGSFQFRFWAERAVYTAAMTVRAAEMGLTPDKMAQLMTRVPLDSKSLSRLDPASGKPSDADDNTRVVNMLLPAVLIGLMFMVIMVGATPAMQGIVEEKGQRIAEVLLGSATPFQIMAGKLIGVIGVSLTMAAVYLAGGYIVAQNAGLTDVLTPSLIVWFLVMLVLALLIFGSLFIAVGAAATDIKDTRMLLMPIMIIACLPFFALGPIIQEPNGPIARACTFFPFSTPMLLVARQAVPPGVPAWELVTGILIVLVTTFFCVWAAGRIFRVGILMTGKGARFGEMIRWVIRG